MLFGAMSFIKVLVLDMCEISKDNLASASPRAMNNITRIRANQTQRRSGSDSIYLQYLATFLQGVCPATLVTLMGKRTLIPSSNIAKASREDPWAS